ncbi:alpha/beta hydrolase family protein [Alkalihalobacillus sp. APA_J-10(15)]|nr:alpha/beta hydrolase family protein [Halalkalibacter sp. APA_J-10(15)]
MSIRLDNFMDLYYQQEVNVMKRDQMELRKKLQQLLGTFSFPQTDKKQSRIEVKEFASYKRERYLIPSLRGLMIPTYVLTPKSNNKAFETVIALHGHGYGSKEIVGLREDGTENTGEPGIHQHFAVELVKRGMKVFAPEVIGFGERRHSKDLANNMANSCYSLATLLLMSGKTLAGLRVAETRHLLDQLKEFSDVDCDRIGLMGFSGGALVAAYASALDRRVKATVLTGFTNTFKGSILHTNHCIDNYVPGILRYGELPDYISLICPRALFVESGLRDPIFPFETTKKAIEELKEIYDRLDLKEQFMFDLFDGGHEVSGRSAYDWLTSNL